MSFPDVGGIPNIRRHIEAHSGRSHVPVPSGEGSAPRPAPQLQRRLALHHGDLEVRTNTWLLQRPNAVPTTCNPEHLPRNAHLGEIHEQRLILNGYLMGNDYAIYRFVQGSFWSVVVSVRAWVRFGVYLVVYLYIHYVTGDKLGLTVVIDQD